jgi:catechol 2,3-dioxygenase-like lactoylglutathione lyase family enzyme
VKTEGRAIDLEVQGVCPLLQVFDMPASLAFYRDLLGFEVVQSSSREDDCDWCLLRQGGAELLLNTQYEGHHRPPVRDSARTLGHSDVSLYFACEDLDALYERLRAREIDVGRPIVRDYGMRQLSFQDPDGYILCYQWKAE